MLLFDFRLNFFFGLSGKDLVLFEDNLYYRHIFVFPDILFACIYQLAKFGDFMICSSKDIFKNAPHLMY